MNSNRRFRPTPSLVISTAALTIAVGTAGGPAIAAAFDAKNADKVDGRHAVGAAATPTQRAGRLVATNAAGKLPNNIISQAPDAAKLGGRTAGEIAFPASASPGMTLRGAWGFDSEGTGAGDFGVMISYPTRVPVTLEVRYVHQGATVAHCPGGPNTPDADPGYLCIHEFHDGGIVKDEVTVVPGPMGTIVRFKDDGAAGDAYADGSWALTMPVPD